MQSGEISPAIPGLHPGYTRKEPTMPFVTDIKTFAALGTGVIGAGWIARALAHGLDVIA